MDMSNFIRISIKSLLDAGSKFEAGSSRTNSLGFDAKTVAIATFLFCPKLK